MDIEVGALVANKVDLFPKGVAMSKESPKIRKAKENVPVDPEPIPGFPRYGAISLQEVFNCRDLGGLSTIDGRRIKKRKLLRSAALHDATAADIKQLVRMHDLSYVIDLRAEYELEKEPDPLPLMHGIEYVNLPALSDDAIGFSGLRNLAHDVKYMREYSKEPFQMVKELYQKCVLGEFGIKAYTKFLHDLLADAEGSTLWHCTQGKDRTGLAALFVEFALGVPHECIRDDYLATNLFIRPWIDKMNDLMRTKILRGLGADIEAYSYANIEYFNVALETIRDNYGSLDNYLTKALDFDIDKRRKLQEMYLE